MSTGVHWATASLFCGIWNKWSEISDCGMKWPWNSAAAWEGTGLPVANSTELRSKDTQTSFKSFLLSFSCQLSATGFAASYSFLFVLIDSFPPYAELHCWKCTPFSDLLLQATSDILQLLLPQHSSPASLLCLWLSGGQHYRMFPCIAARLNPVCRTLGACLPVIHTV